MTITLPVPRSAATRAYGQATVLMRRGGGLTTAAAALVTPYVAGTDTPYAGALYAGPDASTPLVFPVVTGEDGVVELWADAAARLDVEAVHPTWGANRVTLDLEWPPDAEVVPPGVALLAGTQTFTGVNTFVDEIHSEGGLVLDSTTYLRDPIVVEGAAQVLLPATNGLGRLGTVTNRLEALWALSADLSTGVTVSGKPVAVSPDASNALEWRANGLYSTDTTGGGGGLATDLLADAKGDLFAASAADTVGRLALGTNGQVLTADSAQPLGVKWATPTAGGVATDPLADAKGDLFAASGADAVGRLALGTDGHVLTADSTQTLGVKWAHRGGGGSYLPTTGGTMTGVIALHGATASTSVLHAKVPADANPRFRFDASGKLEWLTPTTGAVNVALQGSGSTLQVTNDLAPATTVAVRLGSTSLVWQALYARDLIARSDSGFLEVGLTNPAAAGSVRLRNAQTVSWRNAANSADLSMGMNASDHLALTVAAGALTTSATGGSATALPAQPVGYITVTINGTARKIGYYS